MPLRVHRLNLVRGGYLPMAVGQVAVKWPLLLQAASLPVFEGAVVCIPTAMSLPAFLGLRHPVGMLPVLPFKVAWKILWLAIVALPHLPAHDVDAATGDMPSSVLFVAAVIAVTLWECVWNLHAAAVH